MKLLLTTLLFLFPVSALAAEKSPVVVELFTSQNCAECPGADELLNDIAHNSDSGLIVLGCHVTSWDRKDWKDTLSLEACTQRQKDYAGLLEQGRSYTPHMVVGGRSSFKGDRDFELDLAVRKMRQDDPAAWIDVKMTEQGFEIGLPELPAGQRVPYELTVIFYMTNRNVEIGAGENRGKTILYAHAVSNILRLDPWQGEKETRLLKAHQLNSDHLHGVAVIAQRVRGGPIRAAGEYRIYFN